MTKRYSLLLAVSVATFLALTACGGGEEFPNKSAEAFPNSQPGNICVMDSGCAAGSDYNAQRYRNFGVVTPDQHCSVDYPGAAVCLGTAVQNCRVCSDGHKLCNWGTVDPPPAEACSAFKN